MINSKDKFFYKTKGITLVALVVTVVILLVLAGVSISMLTGENGIITNAIEAKERQLLAQEQERLDLLKIQKYAEHYGDLTLEQFIADIGESDGILSKKDNGDGTYEIKTDNEYIATVKKNENGDIEIIVEGKSDSVNIRIDKLTLTPTSSSITVDVTTKWGDNATYKYYIKDDQTEYELKTTTDKSSHTITGLTTNKKYKIKVEVTNKNGKAEEEESTTTIDLILQQGVISFGDLTWDETTHKASVKITNAKADQYSMKYAITTGSTTTNFQEIANNGVISGLELNQVIRATLWDGTNLATGTSTLTVRDEKDPEVTVTKAGGTSNSITVQANAGGTSNITVQANAVDKQSGMKESVTYKYYIKETGGSYSSSPDATNTTGIYTFTGKDSSKTYDVKVEVDGDKAGNVGIGELKSIELGVVTLTKNNVADYLGKIVTNYTGQSTVQSYTVSPTYRLYYVDFDNKYGDGKGTIYLKAECTSNNYSLPVADTSSDTAENIKIRTLNPSLYAGGVTSPSASNNNMKAVTFLTNTTNWSSLADTTMSSKINYIVGSPSLELMMDSYNTHYKLTGETPDYSAITAGTRRKLFYKYTSGGYGYQVGPDANNSAEYGYWTSNNSVYADSEIDTMYYPGSGKYYWLASPSASSSSHVVYVVYGNGGFVAYYAYGSRYAFCPVVSLKSDVQLQLQE